MPEVRPWLPMNRRELIKCGLAGSWLLGTASLTAGLTGCASTPGRPEALQGDASAQPWQFLSDEDVVLWQALVPVLLAGRLAEAPEARAEEIAGTVRRVDGAIARFSPAKQAELRQLFDLLHLGVSRALLAGVWSSWSRAGTEDVAAFLDRWRTSRIAVFNQGYAALAQLGAVAFYIDPEHWVASGYPGPPEWAVQALPQFQNPAPVHPG